MQVAIEGHYLTNTQPGHNKFYTVLIADNGVVITAWGRIGSAGQSKIQRFRNRDEAETVGLRQFYAKGSKGYDVQATKVKFTVEEGVLARACADESPGVITRAFHKAMSNPEFEGDKKAVTLHYDEFVTKAQKLLDGAGTRSFEEVHNAFEELEAAWAEINDKHAEAEVTVSFLRQTLAQRLMSGALS